LRWWGIDEIESAMVDDTWFAPRQLGPLLRRLVVEGPPPTPINTGV
jgi:hypothetical protein